MTTRQEGPAGEGVPEALVSAFEFLTDCLNHEPDYWTPGEYKAACLLASATDGLKNHALKIKGMRKCPDIDPPSGNCTLNCIWNEIEKDWLSKLPWGLEEIDQQSWNDFLIQVLLRAFAFLENPYWRSQEASFEAGGYRALAEQAGQMMDGLTDEGRRILDDGMREQLTELVSACDQAVKRLQEAYHLENKDEYKEVPNARKDHKKLFQSLAYCVKHYQHGEPPSLRPGHLVAFAKVLAPDDSTRIGDDSLSHEAAGVLRQFKL